MATGKREPHRLPRDLRECETVSERLQSFLVSPSNVISISELFSVIVPRAPMDAFCSGSACGLAKRRRIYPRQTPSIGVVATSFPGAGSGISAAAGATVRTLHNLSVRLLNDNVQSDASSGATTSAPSAPTGRQDPSDAVSGDPPTQSGDSANSGASGDSSQPPESKPSSDPPSSGPSSQPTSKPSYVLPVSYFFDPRPQSAMTQV